MAAHAAAALVFALAAAQTASAQMMPAGTACDLGDMTALMGHLDNECCPAGKGQCAEVPTTCSATCGASLLPMMDQCGDMLSSMGVVGLDALAAECRSSHGVTVDACFDAGAGGRRPATDDSVSCVAEHVRAIEETLRAGGGSGGSGGGSSTGGTVDATQVDELVTQVGQLVQENAALRQQFGQLSETVQQLLIHGLAGVTPTPTGDYPPPPPPPTTGGGGDGGQLAGQVAQQAQTIQSMQATIDQLTRTAGDNAAASGDNAAAIGVLQNAPKAPSPPAGGGAGVSAEGCVCSVCMPQWDSESGQPAPVVDPSDGNQFLPCGE